MKPIFTTATAVLALVASSSIVAAQQDGKQQAPAGQQQDRGSGGASGQNQPSRTQTEDKGPATQEKRSEPTQPAGKEKQAQPKDTPASTKQKQAQPKDEPSKSKQAQPKDTPAAGNDKQAQPKDTPATSKDKQAQQPKGESKDKQARDKNADTKDKQAGTAQEKGGRTQVNDEQRTRIRQSINVTNVQKVTNVNFAISVGTRVPSRVRFYPLPVTIIEFAPDYRDHVYFVVDDRICIVNPRTRAIVLVIDGDGRRSPGQQVALELSADDRQFLLTSIDRERHRADVRIRLALGADVPSQVELYAFPDVVLSRMPNLSGYRFVVVDSEVIIVDPKDRGVALVVGR